MNKALYRKYRSKNLSEIVGQEHITKTLENALKQGKLSHAYLFTGPRGVGKTSIARILAHEINDLPYTDESMHLDIIEIDAASNRRIDEIRDLREKVHIAPTSAKYKVYIIDEVHMLTREAFNALLKTLEEPPAHVVFILATTELHKLPETIVSRTQRFNFKLIDRDTLIGHLRAIAKSEGMNVDDGALELIATQGRGSFRDSISLLDQVGNSSKKVTRADAEKLIGLATDEHISSLLHATLSGSPADILNALEGLTSSGISPSVAAKQLSAVLRAKIISGESDSRQAKLLGALLDVNASADPYAKLEVVLLSVNLDGTQSTSAPARTPEAAPAPAPKPAQEAVQPAPSTEVKKPEKTEEKPANPGIPITNLGDPVDWWGEALQQIKTINNTLYGAMRMATPLVDGDTLNLGFKFKLHAQKASETTTQAKIAEAIEKVTGKLFKINPVVDKNLTPPSVKLQPEPMATTENKPEPVQNDLPEGLDSIKNIFGGAEVLES